MACDSASAASIYETDFSYLRKSSTIQFTLRTLKPTTMSSPSCVAPPPSPRLSPIPASQLGPLPILILDDEPKATFHVPFHARRRLPIPFPSQRTTGGPGIERLPRRIESDAPAERRPAERLPSFEKGFGEAIELADRLVRPSPLREKTATEDRSSPPDEPHSKIAEGSHPPHLELGGLEDLAKTCVHGYGAEHTGWGGERNWRPKSSGTPRAIFQQCGEESEGSSTDAEDDSLEESNESDGVASEQSEASSYTVR